MQYDLDTGDFGTYDNDLAWLSEEPAQSTVIEPRKLVVYNRPKEGIDMGDLSHIFVSDYNGLQDAVQAAIDQSEDVRIVVPRTDRISVSKDLSDILAMHAEVVGEPGRTTMDYFRTSLEHYLPENASEVPYSKTA